MEKVKFVDAKISRSIAEHLSRCELQIRLVWAADCAEHVLSLFEQKHPEDSRPREAIEAGRAWARGEISMRTARSAAFAAHAAARDANGSALSAAARAAGHAAATAHVAGHAVHAATYAAKAVAFASVPAEATGNTAQEREWQFQRLIELSV